MRITNAMITNNTLSHINLNKLNVDKYNTQQSTGKKIQRPSDDPIIAVRALRFRSQLAEIKQYLDKNVEDANSWMELTEEVLTGVRDTLSDMQRYLDEGANDPLDTHGREAVIKTLTGFRDQIYHDANFDFAGRRIFTGYKTDTDMIFGTNEKTTKYSIEQKLSYDDFDTISKVFNAVDVTKPPYFVDAETENVNPPAAPSPDDKTDIHRLRLAYSGLLEKGATGNIVKAPSLTYTDAAGNQTTVTMKVVAAATDGKYYENGQAAAGGELNPYDPGDDEVYFLSDTGEIIFGKEAYQDYKDGELTVNYDKVGFSKGDLRPEHFFDCTRYKEDGTTEEVKFESNQQDINYTINFNQKLKVNSEGRDFFTHDVIRDLDDLINDLNGLTLIDEKISKVDKMLADPAYADDENQKNLNSMKEALEKEKALQGDIVQKRFERSITLYSQHQSKLDMEIADIGSRDNRLQLNKARLTNQKTTIEDLKSSNEDINLPETIIQLSAASMVYDASLSAASKVITKSLLDYL